MADLSADQFVFVDESSTTVTATPRYARAPKGERAHGSAPRNYAHNTTLVAALSPTGIAAAMTLPGALDGLAFVAYVEHVLVPALHPGQIVLLDNLSVHKRRDIQALIEEADCQLRFLPTYSPDFNPIEPVFSKLKERIRRLSARTDETLQAAIADALTTITPSDAWRCFRHCGYDVENQSL